MPVAPKKKVAEFEIPFEKKIEEILRNDPEHAYHISRIMVDHFGIKEDEISRGFSEWQDKDALALWKKIRNALLLLEEKGKVEKRKDGKINYYWWDGGNHK